MKIIDGYFKKMDLLEIEKIIFDNVDENLYQKIKKKKLNKKYWLTIIVPVRGRIEFLPLLLESFKKSIKLYNRKVNIIVVEESNYPLHKEECKKNNVDYFFIESSKNYFNKCICHNIGALLYKNSEYFLFHDLDCLVKENFIVNIFKNIENKKINCLQTFDKRRVLYFNEQQTEKIKMGEMDINEIDDIDLNVGDCCAPGGSILIKKELFFDVGGYDPEIFYGWSPEDRFFWDKVESLENIGICDNPKNEIYHMYHEPQYKDKEQLDLIEDRQKFYESIDKSKISEIIEIKKNVFLKYGLYDYVK